MQRGFQGGCYCGAVRYVSQADSLAQFCCHCLDCQKGAGQELLGRDYSDPEKLLLIALTLLVSVAVYVVFDMRFEEWRRRVVRAMHARPATEQA